MKEAECRELIDRQDVETLAQLTYELAHPMGVLWSQRRPVIRDGWLDAARRRLSEMDETDMRQRSGYGEAPAGGHDGAAASAARGAAVLDAFGRHSRGLRPLSLHTLMRETEMDPAVLVRTVRRMMGQGVLAEMAATTDPSGQTAFRLLDSGHALLAGRRPQPEPRV
ncbi:hypothetical protein [Arenibaculum pallidiluteum]|uniref:hypothetical protein n=1 Tax=Arenibaculum pallidiluteum TaxID=2812559 RepID=UPI001A969EE6|nr:hypothetical protein [Arenibaculum pallidiluteum]